MHAALWQWRAGRWGTKDGRLGLIADEHPHTGPGELRLRAYGRASALRREAHLGAARTSAEQAHATAAKALLEAEALRTQLGGTRTTTDIPLSAAIYWVFAIGIAVSEAAFSRSFFDLLKIEVAAAVIFSIGASVTAVLLSTRAGRVLRQWKHVDIRARLFVLAACLGLVGWALVLGVVRERAPETHGCGWPLAAVSLFVALGGVVVGYFSEDPVPGMRAACAAVARAKARFTEGARRVVAAEHAHRVGLARVDAHLDVLVARYRAARQAALMRQGCAARPTVYSRGASPAPTIVRTTARGAV